jgi:hypothetical protein
MRKSRLIFPIILGISISLLITVGFTQRDTLAAPTILTTRYVDTDNVSGTYDGLTWATAYTNVNDALAVASSIDWIFVAEGVYYTDEGAGKTDGNIWDKFVWNESVDLYGGFDPGSGVDTMNERDWEAFPTVLSGDVNQDDTIDPYGIVTNTANIVGNNSYGVVAPVGLTETAVMDGFTITAGGSWANGAGMYLSGSSPTLVNLKFYGNYSEGAGGGIYIGYDIFSGTPSHPSLTNALFFGNSADFGGGGMAIDYLCNPVLTNVVFLGNSSTVNPGYGGGIYNNSGTPVLENVVLVGNKANQGGGFYNIFGNTVLTNLTISGNSAGTSGGGMYFNSGTPIIKNTILWGNTAPTGSQVKKATNAYPSFSYSDIQGSGGSGSWDTSLGTNGGNNIDANPLFGRDPNAGDGDWTTFGDNDYGDLHLQHGSPAVDTGTNTGCPAYDLDGNPRPIGSSCDIGAFERWFTIFLTLLFR